MKEIRFILTNQDLFGRIRYFFGQNLIYLDKIIFIQTIWDLFGHIGYCSDEFRFLRTKQDLTGRIRSNNKLFVRTNHVFVQTNNHDHAYINENIHIQFKRSWPDHTNCNWGRGGSEKKCCLPRVCKPPPPLHFRSAHGYPNSRQRRFFSLVTITFSPGLFIYIIAISDSLSYSLY